MRNQAVEMLVVGTGDVQIATADVIHCFIVDEERTVRVFNGAVCREDGVVRLYNGGGHLWSGVHGKLKLAFLAVVGRETLKDQGTETRACTTTERVEDKETLEGGAVVFAASAGPFYKSHAPH